MDVGAWEDKLRASLEAKTAKLAEALRRSAQRKGGYCNTGESLWRVANVWTSCYLAAWGEIGQDLKESG